MKTKTSDPQQNPKKKLMEKWQSWVALISATVVLLGAISGLPKKIIDAYHSFSSEKNSCEFYGRLIYADGEPVIGAEVIVQGKKGKGLTDDNGEFNFEVLEKAGSRIQVLIKKDGEIKKNTAETLPGPVTIKLNENP